MRGVLYSVDNAALVLLQLGVGDRDWRRICSVGIMRILVQVLYRRRRAWRLRHMFERTVCLRERVLRQWGTGLIRLVLMAFLLLCSRTCRHDAVFP